MRVLLAAFVLTVLIGLTTTPSAAQFVSFPASAAVAMPSPLTTSAEAAGIAEMVRGANGRGRRWIRRPGIVVVTSVLPFDGFKRKTYVATEDVIDPLEAARLAQDLTDGLGVLTGDRFRDFANVRFERPAAGERVPILRDGQIVVGRFHGIATALNAVGYGGRLARPDGTITSGTIMLDSEYDRTDALHRLLRLHELGHALGYNHVKSQRSIMNPTLGSEPTDFDRRVALIAFR